MDGNPADFEAIGTRLGFRVEGDTEESLRLVWQGARFPAFLCLGIAVVLLFPSVPIVEAIRQRGFAGPAGSLWYFPVMNLILLVVAFYLLSLKRTIVFDHRAEQVRLVKRSLFRRSALCVSYGEVASLRLGIDEVYSGFGVAGSSAAESYPMPSLRLVLTDGETILLDRGSVKRLNDLGRHLSGFMGKPLQTEGSLLH
jgi:hypothetical protein